VAARGEKWKELSNLLPSIMAKGQENVQQTSLSAWISHPGFPPHCWAFNYLDMRATLTQEVFN